MSTILSHTIDVNKTVTISSQTGEDEISDGDDVYGLTSEDEAFVPSVIENLRNSKFNTTFSPGVNVEVQGENDLSDFESNNDVEYNPSSEGSSTDEGEGKGKSTSRGSKLGCRPFIGIDGCHLKGPHGGVLLDVVSLDENNGLFLVAVGVVESENRDRWRFFLQNLNTVIGAHSNEVS
ncbi:hypothetical protein F0562_018533 [Nyssa sinensis]|uniref:MULE transposase domain-containing protein n=1 Tax=Nyssa sinensis TaxID=561372 RepID=A0A5J4ZD95_9ASTE|nr:hypothetical protein F0562_018533 [Nyssa sinensis]